MNTYLGCFWENYSYEISRNLSSNLSIINTSSVTLFFWTRTLLSQFVVVSNKSEFFYIGEYKSLYLFTLQIVFLKPTDFRIHFQSIYFFYYWCQYSSLHFSICQLALQLPGGHWKELRPVIFLIRFAFLLTDWSYYPGGKKKTNIGEWV